MSPRYAAIICSGFAKAKLGLSSLKNKKRGKKLCIIFKFCLSKFSGLSAKARKFTGKLYNGNLASKMKKKTPENSNHASDLGGLCLIHNNACAHKCYFIQVYLETETVVQLHHTSYSPDLSPRNLLQFTLLKNKPSRRRY